MVLVNDCCSDVSPVNNSDSDNVGRLHMVLEGISPTISENTRERKTFFDSNMIQKRNATLL